MMGTLLQIEPTVRGTTTSQVILAGILLAGALFILTLVLIRLRYLDLGGDESEVVAAIRGGLTKRTPGTVRLTDPTILDARRDEIREAFATSGAVEDVTSVRDATRSVVGAVVEAYQPIADRLPPLARRLVGLAVLALVFGAIAVSTEVFVRALETNPTVSDPTSWPALALSESAGVVDQWATWLFIIPGVEFVWVLLFAYGILLAEWLYTHYYVAAAILIIAAAGIAGLHRRGASVAGPSVDMPAPSDVAARVALVTVGVWGIVLLGIGSGRSVSSPENAVTVAAVAGGVAAAAAIVYALAQAGEAARWLARAWRATDERGGRGLLLVRLGGLVAAGLIGPLIPVWAVVAMTKLPTIASAWLAASLGIKTVTLLLAIGGTAGVWRIIDAAHDDIKAALSETVSRRSVQWAIGARAFPWAAVVAIYLLATSFQLGAIVSVGVAIVAGMLARYAWKLFEGVRYRSHLREDDEYGSARVIVHAYELPIPDDEMYVARVNGHLVADPELEGAIDAIVDCARDWFRHGEAKPSLAHEFADDLRTDGVIDPAVTRDRLEEQVWRRAEGRVLPGKAFDRGELEDELEDEFPEDVWRPTLRTIVQSPKTGVTERGGVLYAD